MAFVQNDVGHEPLRLLRCTNRVSRAKNNKGSAVRGQDSAMVPQHVAMQIMMWPARTEHSVVLERCWDGAGEIVVLQVQLQQIGQ